MILADLFKPNKYGTQAIVTTLPGDLVTKSGDSAYVKATYNRTDRYPLTTPIKHLPHKGNYALNNPNGNSVQLLPHKDTYVLENLQGNSGQILLQVHYLHPATADHILVAMTLEEK